MTIDAKGIYYKDLNEMIRTAISGGVRKFKLKGVNGQRYIGTGINVPVTMDIYGIPGSDLAAFMDGPRIVVHNNAQDAIGNTMNEGEVIVHGHAGDVAGFSMRGGRVFIEGDVGYRVGIHMKGYQAQVPTLVAGGSAGDFLGEYMAGGILVVLGLKGNPTVGDYLGTGMHGGVIYVRGDVKKGQCGKEVGMVKVKAEEEVVLKETLVEFCQEFALKVEEVADGDFTRIVPVSSRPYGNLYAY